MANRLIKRETVSARESNRLYQGEVRDFRTAMGAVIRGMQAERREEAAFNDSLAPNEQEFRLNGADTFKTYAEAARVALALYDELVRAAEREVVARLRTLQGDDMNRIADALESGDYADLAW